MEGFRLWHQDEIEKLLAEEDGRLEKMLAAREAEMQTVIDDMETALTEAMSAKGDLLFHDETANQILSERIGGSSDGDRDREGPGRSSGSSERWATPTRPSTTRWYGPSCRSRG